VGNEYFGCFWGFFGDFSAIFGSLGEWVTNMVSTRQRGGKGGEKRSKGGEIPDSNRFQPKYIVQIPDCKSIPAQIYREIQLKNPTQIGSFPKTSKKHLRRSVTFSLIFYISEHPPSSP